jgi:hypothetical protein
MRSATEGTELILSFNRKKKLRFCTEAESLDMFCFNIDLLRLILLSDQRNIQFGNETHSPKVVTLFTTAQKRGSKTLSGRSNHNLSYFRIGPNYCQPPSKAKHFILEKSVFSVAHCMQHPNMFRNQPIISCF